MEALEISMSPAGSLEATLALDIRLHEYDLGVPRISPGNVGLDTLNGAGPLDDLDSGPEAVSDEDTLSDCFLHDDFIVKPSNDIYDSALLQRCNRYGRLRGV
ncbi:hypothetical protein E4U09_005614 [Claviceps aff. purpurea]|uniref:Uncharacterized protein n=1 Tax=Claviceps aff. purpurea TaxID=1967640 RepID=A0A9P7U453_9HYPO|nr:hypothetical protein E4U09_005614 [Claviceps aff. purpurea]